MTMLQALITITRARDRDSGPRDGGGGAKSALGRGQTWFRLDMTLHAEDRYNFNPGAKDITTGIPDSDNGIFEVTGLAKQYTQTATLRRIIEWQYGTLGTGSTSTASIPSRW